MMVLPFQRKQKVLARQFQEILLHLRPTSNKVYIRVEVASYKDEKLFKYNKILITSWFDNAKDVENIEFLFLIFLYSKSPLQTS
jgi:hypothetical protein